MRVFGVAASSRSVEPRAVPASNQFQLEKHTALIPLAPEFWSSLYLRMDALRCDECSKVISRAGLSRHRRLHEGVKTHTCVYTGCTMTFSRVDALTVHIKFHRREYSHVCSECGKAFVQTHDLRRHSRSHLRRKKRGDASAENAITRNELNALREQVQAQSEQLASLALQLLQQSRPSEGNADQPAFERTNAPAHEPPETHELDELHLLGSASSSPGQHVDVCDCEQFSNVGSMPCQVVLSVPAPQVQDEWTIQL
jgi:hypothetical protein